MKKIVIAASLLMAVVANAASVKWSTAHEVANGTASGITSATVAYLINSSVLSQSDIYAAVSGGKTLEAAIGTSYIGTAAMSGGKIAAQQIDDLTAGTLTAYMVLFDKDVSNGSLYFSEQISKTLADVGTQNYGFTSDRSIEAAAADMTGFSASAGGWVSTSVPEPTSGLLLLLGMAGMALKRKRA